MGRIFVSIRKQVEHEACGAICFCLEMEMLNVEVELYIFEDVLRSLYS